MRTEIRCNGRTLRDVLVRAGGVMASTAIALSALTPMASATPTTPVAAPSPSTSAAATPGLVEVDGDFTPSRSCPVASWEGCFRRAGW